MKTMLTTVAVIGLISTAAAYAERGTRDPGVNARQHHQRDRIEQGVNSGELTGRETRRLAKEQQHIRQEERRYKADGELTARERADLHRDQNKASRDIYRQKHDTQDRPHNPGTRDPGVNARQDNQRGRIGQGVRSGELTKAETKELAQDQREIRQEERVYKSDGKLTLDERKDLHQDLNQASKDIYQQKHDDEKR